MEVSRKVRSRSRGRSEMWVLVLTFIMWLCAAARSAFCEDLLLSTESLSGVQSSALVQGIIYEFTVSGTYDYGNAPDTIADAEWSGPPDWTEVVTGYTREADILDVVVDNVAVDWHGSSDGLTYAAHTFSPTHTYKWWYTGQGLPVHFRIADLFPWGGDATGDNEGSLAITVTPIPEPSGLLALVSGLGGLAGMVWRRRK